MRLSTIISACALALAAPSLANAQESENTAIADEQLALARQVIENGFPPETRIDSMVGVADQLIAQMIEGDPRMNSNPQLEPVIQRFRGRVLQTTRDVLSRHIDDMMEGMAVAYAESFSHDELTALHEFVSSPAGYGFLTRITDINSHPAYAEANQAYVNEYLSYLPGLQQELMQDVFETLDRANGVKQP